MGARDYQHSYWQVEATRSGTLEFVPASCCRQRQDARPWRVHPIDGRCVYYDYDTRPFYDAVHVEARAEKLFFTFSEGHFFCFGENFADDICRDARKSC